MADYDYDCKNCSKSWLCACDSFEKGRDVYWSWNAPASVPRHLWCQFEMAMQRAEKRRYQNAERIRYQSEKKLTADSVLLIIQSDAPIGGS